MDPRRHTVAGQLVGRGPAVAALTAAVDDAVRGRGGVVLLTGDPGIGKTALAAAAAELAASRGAAVGWGTCWDGGHAPGFWPWIQVLRGLHPGRPTVLERETSGNEEADERSVRFRQFDDVANILRSCAGTRPVVVVLDDLHWADVSSVRLLAFLGGQLRDAPVLFVGAYRDVEVAAADHPLHDLLPGVAERGRVLPLAGLGASDVAELMRRLTGSRTGEDLAAELHRRTGGNPFFVEQLAQLPDLAAGLPPVVGDVVARRLDRLSGATRRLLEAGAVVGTEFDTALAAGAADDVDAADEADAGHALEEAERARIVAVHRPGAARFAHDLFREVLYDRLPAARRRRLHLAVAEQLEGHRAEGRPVAPQQPAHHRFAALPLGDRSRAVAALLASARDATRRGAFDEALLDFQRALDAHGTAGVEPALLVEHGHALRRAARPDAAYAQFLAVAERARAAGDARVLAAAALGAHRVTTSTDVPHTEVIELLEAALPGAAGPGARADRCLLLAALARELGDGPARDEPRAEALVREAVREGRLTGDPRVLAHALWALVDVRWRPGTARERLALTGELAAAAQGAGERELVLEAQLTRVVALLELADPAWSTALDEFGRLADEVGVPHYRYLALSRRALRACLTGPLEVADALVDEAAAVGEQIGEPDAWGVRASQLLGLALLRGDWSRIQAVADAVGRPLVPPQFAPMLSAHLHLERGEVAVAAAFVAGLLDVGDVGYRWRRTIWLTELAELAVAVGDRELCARLYDLLLPAADTLAVLGGAVSTSGPVALQLGLLAGALDRPDDAVAHLEHAVALAERSTAALHAVRARSELAAALLARGRAEDRGVVRQLLGTVAAEAERLGYAAAGSRARAGLAALDDAAPDRFERDGDVWTLQYAGRTARLRDAKGLHDLARLLASPGQEVAAVDLLGPAGVPALGADPVLDDRARAAYRLRISELDTALHAADAAGDAARSAALTDERTALVRELATASGLGGRRRRLGDVDERARTTVTARIRDSIRHIEQVHPELGGHLRASVVTGVRCCYRPAGPGHWGV